MQRPLRQNLKVAMKARSDQLAADHERTRHAKCQLAALEEAAGEEEVKPLPTNASYLSDGVPLHQEEPSSAPSHPKTTNCSTATATIPGLADLPGCRDLAHNVPGADNYREASMTTKRMTQATRRISRTHKRNQLKKMKKSCGMTRSPRFWMTRIRSSTQRRMWTKTPATQRSRTTSRSSAEDRDKPKEGPDELQHE